MKKIMLILLFLLMTNSVFAADRISPSEDIGIFVDPDLFWKGLQRTPLYDLIYEHNTEPYTFNSNLIKFITDYNLEGDITIRCWINRYNKIHAIKIMIAPWYFLDDNCYDESEILYYVLSAAGLLIHEDDYNAVDAMLKREKDYLGRNFYVERYTTDYDVDLNIEVSSIYYSAPGLNPYNLMDIFTDHPCDQNYIGACIPIVSYDIDCSDIPVRNFFVTGKDKHRFDGDGNGVCCEPYPIQ